MLRKPGKDLHLTASYRLMSLFLILSEILKKIILKRMETIIEERRVIPDHQFGLKINYTVLPHS